MQHTAPYKAHLFDHAPAESVEGQNFYEFVGNNPANIVDLLGLQGGAGAITPPSFPEAGFIPGQNGALGPTTINPGSMGAAWDLANYEPGHFHPSHPDEPVFGANQGNQGNTCPNPNYRSIVLSFDPETGDVINYGYLVSPPSPPPQAVYNSNSGPYYSTSYENTPATSVTVP